MSDPLVGKKLGDYTIQSLLGRGGMSRVYRGYDENLDRYAAVKVISGDFATTTEEEYTRRFQIEARAIAHLRHTNIVGVYQFGRFEGIYYMAQVFLEGQDLRMLLQKYALKGQRVPVSEVLKVVKDVTDALDYAHDQGVIHRDIKPSNIMLEKRTGRAILMDFGLALSVQEGTMGDTFGSAHYIAPEQAINSKNAVPQSDLYSLGVVIYEMLSGKVPFDDPSVMAVALKHLNELPPPPTLFNPDLPPAVEAVILKTLDKDPAERYVSGAELVAALEAAFKRSKGGAGVSARGSSVAEMIDAPSPAPPAPVAPFNEDVEQYPPKITPPPFPPVRGAAPDEPEDIGGIAGRFARRRARKEEAVAAELTDEDLQLDNAALDRLLDTLHDPSEVGLVGPDAKGLKKSDITVTPDATVPEPAAAELTGVSAPPRKRRRGLLVFFVLLLVIAVVAGWIVTQGGGDRDEGEDVSGLSPADRTATALVMAGAPATNTPKPRATNPPLPTRTPVQPMVDVSDVGPSSPRPTDRLLPSPTNSPTASPTETPTSPPSPTEPLPPPPTEMLPTSAPGETPTVPPTFPPTDTPVSAGEEPATPGAFVDNNGGSGQRPTETTTEVASGEGDIRLIYEREPNGQGSFILINASQRTLDITPLVFEQPLPDGSALVYEARLWDRPEMEGGPASMVPGSCIQLVTTDGTPKIPATAPCELFMGFYRTNTRARYFWLANEPGATFIVRVGADGPALATCEIDAGECAFMLTAASGETPPVGTTTPPPASGGDANVRVIYDEASFILVNISERELNVRNVRFERQSTISLYFTASEWDGKGITGTTSSLESGTCYQLVWADFDWRPPADDDCPKFGGWYGTTATRRYFWKAEEPGLTFTVRLGEGGPVLATCEIDAGMCEFAVPQE
ncbi:MAG: serine/threonine protein kinase [Anaerolineae bacterium]|nr:serine/threonine protein kinase [Anaerolineae bacterium]